MYALISLIIILTISMLTVRVGTVALELTGMSRDVASFQATSAFSGAGFTTQEAEEITAYPARRRVVKTLIRLGNVGIITSIASIVLSFMNAPARPDRVLAVAATAVAVVLVVRSTAFERAMNPLVRRLLRRTATFELRDYTGLLQLYDNHQVADLRVREGEWLANERLADLDLRECENVLVLGIQRPDGTYIAPPSGEETIRPGDTVIAYGRDHQLLELADRSQDDAGDGSGGETAPDRRLRIQRGIDPDAPG
jgi:hypothetical protein